MNATVELVVLSCGYCHIQFAVPRSFDRAGRENGSKLWCPAGHEMTYRERHAERLLRERDALRARLTHETDQREAAERSAAAYKGHLTRLRKRIMQGVCPHCDRAFQNVMRHMASQHPAQVEKAREALAGGAS